MYSYFYFSINAGAVIAYASAEVILRNEYLTERGINSMVAFGLPGVLMVIATLVFWMGRNKFIAIKPAGWKLYKEELFSAKGWALVKKLAPLYIFVSVFFTLFDQTASTWVDQAGHELMNKTINLGFVKFDFLASQLGFFNPLLIVIFIPLITGVLYPYLRKRTTLTYVKRIAIGLFLTAISNVIISMIQTNLDAGISVNISWQILAYVILTAGEIFVSVTVLEFSYTQAPNRMKSFILSFYLLSVALGQVITMLSALFLKDADGELIISLSSFFWMFTGLMFVTGVVFSIVFRNFKEEHHIQSRADAEF